MIVLRPAGPDDVPAICRFGVDVVGPHYLPILGAEAAAAQVRHWWNADAISQAMASGPTILAEDDGDLVGIGQLGSHDGEPVVWKLYLAPDQRGHGLGRELLARALLEVPAGARRVLIEHFAGNVGAAAFYEREGFTVLREERHVGDNRALDVVWRARPLT